MNSHLDVDINISREEIYRLAKTRPFWKFVSFPINIKTVEKVMSCNCSFFECGQVCVCGKFRSACGHGVECYDTCVHKGYYTDKVDTKPKKLKPKKETYVSPFTGKTV